MILKFCPLCAGPLSLRQLEHERHRQPVCAQCGYIAWQNPKPTVSALLLRRLHRDGPDEVLLVQRALPPRKGTWDCPGGFIDPDEHPAEALRRELQEELNVEATLSGLVGIYMDRYGEDGESTLNIYYRGTICSGTPSPGSDVSSAAWFALDHLPEPLAFDNNHQALEALRSLLGSG